MSAAEPTAAGGSDSELDLPSNHGEPDSPCSSMVPRLLLLATLVYGFAHLVWYWGTPLGQVAVLDELENVEIARQIATGTLPSDPFYRAMGFPALLAILLRVGVAWSVLPLVATALGLVLHVANTAMVLAIAQRIFGSVRSGLIAGALHGLNPVLIHYATQVLDGTLANTMMLAGLLCALAHSRSMLSIGSAAVLWSCALLVRPQFILVVGVLPIVWWLSPDVGAATRRRLIPLAAAFGAALLPLGVVGLVQMAVSGDFRVMPTQGSYNLWAANKPGAHGRYFVQSIHLPVQTVHENPTRIETRLLFERETGRTDASFDEINAYWSARLRAAVLDDPAGFAGRLLRKVYFFFNDFDQYNNKSYFVHKERSPVLRLNPIGWGLVLLVASAGLVVAWDRLSGPRLAMVLAVGVATAIPVLLTFVSGRFRMPHTALLCICAGGMAECAVWWRSVDSRRVWMLLAILGLLAGFAFSRLARVHDTKTAVQDHILMADAAVQVGADLEAWEHAGRALEANPEQVDALAWRVSSYFNLLLTGQALPGDEPAWADAARRFLRLAPNAPNPVVNIAALALWRDGQRSAAANTWRKQGTDHGDSEAWCALFLAGEVRRELIAPALASGPRGAFSKLALATVAPVPSARDEELRRAARRAFGP